MILKHYYRSAVLHWWKLSLIQRKSSANYLYNCAEDDTITDISLELLHYWYLLLILRLLLFKFVLVWNIKEKKFSDSFLDNKQKTKTRNSFRNNYPPKLLQIVRKKIDLIIFLKTNKLFWTRRRENFVPIQILLKKISSHDLSSSGLLFRKKFWPRHSLAARDCVVSGGSGCTSSVVAHLTMNLRQIGSCLSGIWAFSSSSFFCKSLKNCVVQTQVNGI